ncbi:hypothetical protein NHX12_015100 [Muraenolepis orangiensis]|uniref:Uncharacterized protein n=1 Tax=Muraenolepis orangiensis TaxID=630683 RepID=A0A9Q0I478_9TELE|nr:hypothetical protein NHX12_015100 [Muraenolepis orangiensis]
MTTEMESSSPGTPSMGPTSTPTTGPPGEAHTSPPPDPTLPPSHDDAPDGQDSTDEWDDLPWVRIGIIAGVLAFTGVTLCILRARRVI